MRFVSMDQSSGTVISAVTCGWTLGKKSFCNEISVFVEGLKSRAWNCGTGDDFIAISNIAQNYREI